MRIFAQSLFFCLCFFFAYISANTSECFDLGFDSESLECKVCDQLFSFTRDTDLLIECQKCCKEADGKAEHTPVESIVLTIGGYYRELYPHIDSFIKNHAKDYPKLTVRDIRGAVPRLEWFGANGKSIGVTRISGWKTEDLIEFVSTTLSNF